MSGPRGWGEPTWGQRGPEPTPAGTVGDAPGGGGEEPRGSGPMGPGELVERTIAVIRWAPGVTWAFGGATVALLAIVEGWLVSAAGLRAYAERFDPDDLASFDAQLPVVLASLLVSVLAWVTGLLATAVCAGVAAVVVERAPATFDGGGSSGSAGSGGSAGSVAAAAVAPPSVAQVWATLRPRMGGVLGLTVLLALTVAVLAGAPVAWVVALGAAGAWPLALGGGALLALVAIGAAFWVAPILALALPEYVAPGSRRGSALARSARLVRGQRWRLVGIWLLCTIVLALANGVIAGPVGWLSTLLAPVGHGEGATWSWVIGGAVSAGVTAPIGALVLAIVHRSMLDAEDGEDGETSPGSP